MKHQISAEGPSRLWVSDVPGTQPPENKVYLAVVVDAWSRRVIGWSIADRMRAEFVVDALQMAVCRTIQELRPDFCYYSDARPTRGPERPGGRRC